MKAGFIGGGNMGGALVRAVAEATDAADIAVYDPDAVKVEILCRNCGVKAATAEEIAEKAAFVILAVKPQVMAAALLPIQKILAARKTPFTLVTIAAGISIAAFRGMAGGDYPVVRLMPNTPAMVGEGMILLSSAGVSETALADCKGLLSHAGKVDAVPEEMIDVGGALSGCGPAYVCLFAEALADGAVACGLSRAKARLYAAQTLLGTAKMLLDTESHPGELKDAVCSPGGTTIAGVRALEEHAFRAAAADAVVAAYEKTLAMKNGK